MSTDDNVSRDEPSPTQRRAWYARASTWVMATVLAGIATFVTTQIADLLKSGIESVRSPVEISVNRVKDCPFSYIVPGTPDGVAPAPDPFTSPTDVDSWARTADGVDGEDTVLEVNITGGSDKPVTLFGIDIEILSRETPIQGFQARIPCGDAIPLRIMEIDLDSNPPSQTESPVVAANEPISFPYRVNRTESEAFLIYASTESCNCSWRAKLRWAVGGESGISIIDDAGEPFRTHFVDSYPVFLFNEPPLA